MDLSTQHKLYWRQELTLPQHTTEMVTINALVVLPNTIISFLNIKTASPPIQNAEARVKYWIRKEMAVQEM